eukprot:TRINITY_DN28942_c1_g3_i1.p1 TRINITY_DN28942_c1_g3~~TRINITY_DN28942_c1_g3_i1.p1  ORF type:complete len:955 (+),score=204.03 TRINITY_DN28942_c1_g3_i1:44-2908(+)
MSTGKAAPSGFSFRYRIIVVVLVVVFVCLLTSLAAYQALSEHVSQDSGQHDVEETVADNGAAVPKKRAHSMRGGGAVFAGAGSKEPVQPAARRPAETDPGRPVYIGLADEGVPELKSLVEAAAARAGSYLIEAVEEDGRFCYVARSGAPDDDCDQRSYNLLRHAGAIYALGMLEARQASSVPGNRILPAVEWLLQEAHMRPPIEHPEVLAMWGAAITRKHPAQTSKLGGSGLTLVALSETSIHALLGARDGFNDQVLSRLGDFLRLMQRAAGDFQSRYHERLPNAEAFDEPDGIHPLGENEWVSLYYQGEGAFGLVSLYETVGNVKYLDAAEQALIYLADMRKDMPFEDVQCDHWALIATAHYLHTAHADAAVATKLIEHGEKVTKAILYGEGSLHESSDYAQRLATRLEGLHAFLPWIRNTTMRTAVISEAHRWVRHLVRYQVTTGPLKGGWTDRLAEAFDDDGGDIRIDSVQHTLSALLSWIDLVAPGASVDNLPANDMSKQEEDEPNKKAAKNTVAAAQRPPPPPSASNGVQELHSQILAMRKKQEEWTSPANKTLSMRRETLEQSLELGSKFLLKWQKDDGSFRYLYDWLHGAWTPGDSSVRQAGALWGIALTHRFYKPTAAGRDAIEKALEFWLTHSEEGPTYEGQATLMPRMEGEDEVTTGVVALTSLSLIEHLQSNIELPAAVRKVREDQLDKYLRFLCWMQMDNGLISQSYELASETSAESSSPYYDGEALLAMTKAARELGRTWLIPVIQKAAEGMTQKHVVRALHRDEDSKETKGFFQWSCMAFAEYYKARWPDFEVYGDAALLLANWMVYTHDPVRKPKNTGYAIEGLMSAYGIAQLRGSQEPEAVSDALRHVVDVVLYKLTGWQIGHPHSKLVNPFLQTHTEGETDPLAFGGVMNGAAALDDCDPSGECPHMLRIDVTQHQMHAVMMALDLYKVVTVGEAVV